MNEPLLLAVVSMVNLLQFGVTFAFGATFPFILEKYGQTRARVALVHSILMGITLGFGNERYVPSIVC